MTTSKGQVITALTVPAAAPDKKWTQKGGILVTHEEGELFFILYDIFT